MKKHIIPTGVLFVDDYSRGKLETLSIGDYGKRHNIKADFLGYTREIEGVPNVECMPLSEKWVITVSTQYGCPMRCSFCDVPNIKFAGNATENDLLQQFYSALMMFPETTYTDRLNLHFARMGDPAFNTAVQDFSLWLYENKRQIHKDTGVRIETLHPVFTTSMPKAVKSLGTRLRHWCHIKNDLYNGQAGLQLSINSTSERQRNEMFGGAQHSLEDISRIAEDLPDPLGRKYCLNFAYSTDFEIDASEVVRLFNPEHWMCKITPIHNNNACRENGIETLGGYDSWLPYRQPEGDLKSAGFDVLVFVPSMDEEDGLVTCGNAILGGSSFPRSPADPGEGAK